MKLSKKNAARQRVLQKAIASGKTLGGLLVSITAATVVGGCRGPSPASTMGRFPDPRYEQVKHPQPKQDAVQERKCDGVVRGMNSPSQNTNDVNEIKDREVLGGDI